MMQCYGGNNTSDNILADLYMYLVRTAVDPISYLQCISLSYP